MVNDCQVVWERCLLYIRDRIDEQTYKTWFLPIIAKSLIDDVLTIQVPSQFFYEWLEEHYFFLLKKAVCCEIGPNGKLEYAVVIDSGNHKQKPLMVNLPSSTSTGSVASDDHRKFLPYGEGYCLNPNYTFSRLIEGDCNQLAKSAAEAVAKQPGRTAFNPLMIYGGVGLGKTHISQAIGNQIAADYPAKIVTYISSEKFTSCFIDALRGNKVSSFIDQFLKMDVLILDDIQFLAGKEKTQEVFFHIFNHLYQTKKQIVITSDCAPRDLKGLQERLLSRFKWGLTTDLQCPDFETRVAILHSKAFADGITLPSELIEYVAKRVNTNIRELEGVLISIVAHASLVRKDVSIELAEQVLNRIIHASLDSKVDIEVLQKKIVDFYKIPSDDLQGRSRKKEIVHIRQIAMHLVKKYTNYSLQAIGTYFGGRDHTTVLHALKVVDGLLEKDPAFAQSYSLLDDLIKRSFK